MNRHKKLNKRVLTRYFPFIKRQLFPSVKEEICLTLLSLMFLFFGCSHPGTGYIQISQGQTMYSSELDSCC